MCGTTVHVSVCNNSRSVANADSHRVLDYQFALSYFIPKSSESDIYALKKSLQQKNLYPLLL